MNFGMKQHINVRIIIVQILIKIVSTAHQQNVLHVLIIFILIIKLKLLAYHVNNKNLE